MLSCTLNQYKQTCNANLIAFLEEYEDNTKNFFLQKELEKYQTYQKALNTISSRLAFYTREELNKNPIHKSVASKLKQINKTAYDNIIREINLESEPIENNILSLSNLKQATIIIDEVALKNHISSSIVILNLIAEEYNFSINQNKAGFLFYNRYQSIFSSRNSILPNKEKKNNELPIFKNVFFVHYQCDDFNISKEIKSLSIFAEDHVIDFINKSEAENIVDYCDKVKDLIKKGLTPIHWSQNRPYFGREHITSRYFELSGNNIELEYTNSLNLSGILKHKFGENYVNHPRLDNLAVLNSFNGISTIEKGKKTFDANRVLLLSKIYFGLLNNSLKIGNNTSEQKDVEIIEDYGSIKAPYNTHKITSKEPTKKIPDKWHALLYLIEVEVYNKKIPTNNDGDFIKSQLEEIGKQRCKNSGQGFYRQVRDLKDNINSNISIKRLFNDDWIDVIIELSKNDEKIIKYLNKNYK